LRYQSWIAVKRNDVVKSQDNAFIPVESFGAIVFTKYWGALNHTKTRVAYDYCLSCEKTTKDYGGKKHLYDQFGTLISDVWKDLNVSLNGDLEELYSALSDLFSISIYDELRILDFRKVVARNQIPRMQNVSSINVGNSGCSRLLLGDCLEELKKIPSNSIDFIFSDPPYNLKKNYEGHNDGLESDNYFGWCDLWLKELVRVLKPGKTLAVLNIPNSIARYAKCLNKTADYQNWIVWDALSNPERKIMPAHYTIVCYTKGEPASLPGLSKNELDDSERNFLMMTSPEYCLRPACVKKRRKDVVVDTMPLTDLWRDIHRLKHNTKRVDHPTQLPPQLMYRLISTFTKKGEIILDPFNGSGTTTLCAEQLGRDYIGIEKSQVYYDLSLARHKEISIGLDPFRKVERNLTSKNSSVPRMKKIKYEVPKKTLQLEVKDIANQIGHIPTRDEVAKLTKYPMKYFSEYFLNWGEVCAAARTTGMVETKKKIIAIENFLNKD
jgi:site-specific DNA-methyltransferase (adenine-specific)